MHYDDLDRALFALPLEEPPADLRASILAATVYRRAIPLAVWEAVLIGISAAVTVWLIALLAMGGAPLFLHTASTIGSVMTRALSNVTLLAWLATGCAVAFWLWFFTGSQPFARAFQRYDGRSSR